MRQRRHWLRRPAARLAVALLWGLAEQVEAGEPRLRTLFIALDAVPYQVVADVTDPALGEKALFRGFHAPVPLVSSFPSTTTVAMSGILEPFGLEISPGYEARFFDWEARRVRGGGPVSYFRIDFPWREFFDWNRKGPVGSAFEALRPLKASVGRLRAAIESFPRSESPSYWIYIAGTDTAGHLKGPEALKKVFVGLDELLRKLRDEHPELRFQTVILSDHGMAGGAPLVNVWKPVLEALSIAGYRYKKRLRRPGDVVLTPFGLVSSFELYTLPEEAAAVAEVVAAVPEVDLCAVQSGDDSWRLFSGRGSAEIRRRRAVSGDMWSYEARGGDPLGYASPMQELRRSTAGRGSWFADRRWFDATREGRYPDALYRVAGAFALVHNPASVLCSAADGYMFGARTTERMARLSGGRLRWTHGALSRDATLGFLLTDAQSWRPRPAVRFDASLRSFAAAVSASGGPDGRPR